MPAYSLLTCLLAFAIAPAAAGAAPPNLDADMQRWWALTADLSSDAMEGRDIGSPGHARAVDYVIDHFKAAGLKPGGSDGRWTQTLPLHEVRVEVEGTRFAVLREGVPAQPLRFLHEISVRADAALQASLDASLAFRGYCSRAELGDNAGGKVVVCFGGRRKGVPGAAERVAAATAAGAVGVVSVDDPGFTIEPARWPDAYARTVRARGAHPVKAAAASATVAPANAVRATAAWATAARASVEPANAAPAVMRLASPAFALLLQGSGHDAQALLAAGSASQPLPSFDMPARLHVNADLNLTHFPFRSPK